MHTVKKIFKITYVICMLLSMSYVIIFPQNVLAATSNPDDGCKITDYSKAIKLQMPFPGITQAKYSTVPLSPGQIGEPQRVLDGYYVKDMSCYIGGFYRYFSGLAGIIATGMMIYGGFQYVASAGNPGKLSNARDTIFSAITGLVLTLGVYVILNFVNPNLTTLKLPDPASVSTLFQGTNWCQLQQNPTPKVANKTDCGDVGVYPDKKECIYQGQCSVGYVCAPSNWRKNKPGDSFSCAAPSEVCNSVNAISDLTERQSACNQISYRNIGYGSGICVFVPYALSGHKKISMFDFAKNAIPIYGFYNGFKMTTNGYYELKNLVTGKYDNCYWLKTVDCEDGWTRKPCSECNTNNNCPVFQYEVCDETIPVTDDILMNSTREDGTSVNAICCQQVADPTKYYCPAANGLR